jgi:AcrR family transcriptional regulator
MSSDGAERRARRAGQRRQEILEAAARVFARRGFEKATTREIALEADAAEGTIYNYFTGKQELVAALAEMVRDELAAVIPQFPQHGDERTSIAMAVEQMLTLLAENEVVIRGLVTALWDRGPHFQGYLIPGAQVLIGKIEAYLQARINAGVIRDCDVHVVARMVMGMVVYVAMPYLQDIEPFPLPEERHRQAELLVGVLLDGLRT